MRATVEVIYAGVILRRRAPLLSHSGNNLSELILVVCAVGRSPRTFFSRNTVTREKKGFLEHPKS